MQKIFLPVLARLHQVAIFLTEENGGERNAMRHTIWQGGITERYGKDIAKEAGDAHEKNPIPNMRQKLYPGNEDTDLRNNQTGRAIGYQLQGQGMQAVSKAALTEFHQNGLYVATKQPDGQFKVGKQRISTEKYKKMWGVIENRDKNGYPREAVSPDASNFQKNRKLDKQWAKRRLYLLVTKEITDADSIKRKRFISLDQWYT